MKDVTNTAFLKTLAALRTLPDFFITEYFRTIPHHKKLSPHILHAIDNNPTGKPIYAQLLGSDPQALCRDALELLRNHPCAGINLNLGCPAPLVCRRYAGGGMLRSPKTIDTVLGKLREVIPPGQFTVKCRLGYESPQEFERILPVIAAHAPDRVCIHARTVKEGYRSPVHTHYVAHAVATLPCPVIANGNVVDLQTARAWIIRAAPAGLLIGRAILRNPWFFEQLRQYLAGVPVRTVLYRDLLFYIRLLHQYSAELQTDYKQEQHIHSLKKYLIYTAKGLPQAFEYHMKRAKTSRDLLTLCEQTLDNDTPFPLCPPQDSRLFARFADLLTPNKC